MAGLGDVANAIGGVFGASSNAPTLQTADLDAGTRQLMDQGLLRASRSTSDFAADTNRGASEAAQSVGGMGQAPGQPQEKFGMDQGMESALRNAYNSKAQSAVGDILNRNRLQANFQKADYLRKMTNLALGQQQIAMQTNQMLTDAYNQAEMARAGLISSLFQVGTTALGMYAGNKAFEKKMAKVGAANKVGGAARRPVGYEDYGSGGMGEPMPSMGSGGEME